MKKYCRFIVKLIPLVSLIIPTLSYALDWDQYPVPVGPGAGKSWQLEWKFSDQFNYNGKVGTNFEGKWKDTYFTGWTGPGRTEWAKSHSDVKNGKLILRASPKNNSTVNMGIISSKAKVHYPVYIEAMIKPANLELSSNLWMLSSDATQELDILEIYAGSAQTWWAKRANTNFHIFFRDQNTNAVLKDFKDTRKYTTNQDNGYWRSGYHRFGAYWKSPTEVTFYMDGQLMPNSSWANRVFKSGAGEILQNKNQHSVKKNMHIIIDLEEHEWRFDAGNVDSNAALNNNNRNRMYVDWIRTYRAK